MKPERGAEGAMNSNETHTASCWQVIAWGNIYFVLFFFFLLHYDELNGEEVHKKIRAKGMFILSRSVHCKKRREKKWIQNRNRRNRKEWNSTGDAYVEKECESSIRCMQCSFLFSFLSFYDFFYLFMIFIFLFSTLSVTLRRNLCLSFYRIASIQAHATIKWSENHILCVKRFSTCTHTHSHTWAFFFFLFNFAMVSVWSYVKRIWRARRSFHHSFLLKLNARY